MVKTMMSLMTINMIIDVVKLVGYIGVKIASMHKSLLMADLKLLVATIA